MDHSDLQLVGGLVAILHIFPLILEISIIIPIDEVIFFRGVALAHQPVQIYSHYHIKETFEEKSLCFYRHEQQLSKVINFHHSRQLNYHLGNLLGPNNYHWGVLGDGYHTMKMLIFGMAMTLQWWTVRELWKSELGVFIYFLWKMGSQLELQLEFSKHLIVDDSWVYHITISGWWFGCHQFYFPHINWVSNHHLIDEVIFFRGVQPNHQPDIVIFNKHVDIKTMFQAILNQ